MGILTSASDFALTPVTFSTIQAPVGLTPSWATLSQTMTSGHILLNSCTMLYSHCQHWLCISLCLSELFLLSEHFVFASQRYSWNDLKHGLCSLGLDSATTASSHTIFPGFWVYNLILPPNMAPIASTTGVCATINMF